MNNLRRFNTEAEYSAATLNYPAVSWVVSGDTVHYDKQAPTPSPAVKVAFTTDSCVSDYVVLASDAGILDIVSAITVNGVDFEPLDSEMYLTPSVNTDYLIEYELMDDATDMGYQFNYVSTPMGCAFEPILYDILFPEQVTNIDSLNTEKINNIIILAETPPTVELNSSTHGEGFVYVPDASVNSYITAWHAADMDDLIKPISEYQGNLPV